LTSRNVKLKNRAGEYLLPYTDNLPTASTSTAGKVKLDASPVSGSANAVTSGAVYTALTEVNTDIAAVRTEMSNFQTSINTALGNKLDSSALEVVDSLPTGTNATTFYFVKESS
jgi:hypothetical protein